MTEGDAAAIAPGMVKATEPATIDAYLAHWATERPDAVAVTDAPNREAAGLGGAGVISYSDLNTLVDRIARAFLAHGLRPGDIVALQIPNIAECLAITLGAWRAGLITSPMPLLWRLSEIETAFDEVAPSAIVTIPSFAGHEHAESMRDAALKVLSIRYIFSFGDNLPDGVTNISDWLTLQSNVSEDPRDNLPAVGEHQTAQISWGVASGAGPLPVPRTHGELMSLGRAVANRLEVTSRDTVLSAYPLSSLVAACGLVVPTLIAGARLVLHLPFDFTVFLNQLAEEKVTYAALPPAILEALDEGRHYAREALHLRRVACVWPSVAMPREKQLLEPLITTFDMRNLNEISLLVRRRQPGRDPTLLPLGKLHARWGSGEDTVYLETRLRGSVRSAGSDSNLLAGELRLRGPTIPHGPFAAAGKVAQVLLRPDHHGYIGTRIHCAVDPDDMEHVRCEISNGLIQHGGVTISANELDSLYQAFPDFLDAAALSIEDPVMGNRVVAAVVPRPDISPSLEDFRTYLQNRNVAVYKFPDQLVVVHTIPRGSDGAIEREEILGQF